MRPNSGFMALLFWVQTESMKYLVGMGNYSMSDDGIGLRIVEHIIDQGLNKKLQDSEVHDIANDTLKLLSFFNENTETIMIVDCVRMGKAPGHYQVFSPHDVSTKKDLAGFSTHEGDLLKILDMAKNLGYAIPPIRIFGIEPASLILSMELSSILQSNFEQYIRAVLSEFQPV